MPIGLYLIKHAPGLLALLAAVLIAGCSGNEGGTGSTSAPASAPQAPSEPAAVKGIDGDPVAGKELYFKHCHYCHGERGMGDGPVGIALTPHPADFVHDQKRMSQTDLELFKSITEGIRKEIGGEAMTMPRWKEILTEQERWDVLAFVRQLEREGKEAEAVERKMIKGKKTGPDQ